MFVLVILIFFIIGFLEIVPLYKAGQRKELALYSFLFAGAFTVSLLLSLHIELPNAAKGMDSFFDAIMKFFSS